MTDQVIWIGLADVMPQEGNDVFGDSKGAFVNVVALASSKSEFCDLVQNELAKAGFVALTIEDVEPLLDRLSMYTVSEDLLALSRQLDAAGDIRFGTFHSYREDETLN